MLKKLLVCCACLLLTVQGAWALTITNDGSTIWSDNFESGTVGEKPSGWDAFSRDDLTTVESSAGANQGSKYLEIRRADGVLDGEISARFDSQSSGTVTADFAVYLPSNGDKGSATRVAFSQGGNTPSECCEVSARHMYLMTGNWGSLGADANDVVASYHQGSYQYLANVCSGCADTWVDVSLTQSTQTGAGSEPVITMNGTIVNTYPFQNGKGAIDGLNFGMNSASGGLARIDAIPEPTTVALLLMGIGSLLAFARRRIA